MINKYTMLGAMYRYEINSYTWSQKKIESTFLETTATRNFITRALVKRDVLKNFNIVDKNSCLSIIEDFFRQSTIENPSLLVLYHLWNRYDKLLDLQTINEALSKEFDFKDIVQSYYTEVIELSPYSIEVEDYEESLKEKLKTLCNGGQLNHYIEFFKTYNWLIRLSGSSLLLGYDISRAVEIITKSTTAGYLSSSDCDLFLNRIGHVVKQRFNSWEQYFASCLLGKVFLMYDSSDFNLTKLKESNYIKAVYGLSKSSNRIPLLSGLWPNSNLIGFSKVIDRFFHFDVYEDESHLNDYVLRPDEVTAIDLFKHVVFEPAIKLGVGCYFSASDEKGNFYHPLMAVGKRFIFWDVIARRNHKYNIETSIDEIPFLMTNQATFTNKAVYIFERKMLIKRDLIPIKWADVQFSFKVGYSCEFINVYINGHKVGYLPLYLSRIGVENDSELFRMSDVKLNELFKKEESILLEKLFNDIPNRL